MLLCQRPCVPELLSRRICFYGFRDLAACECIEWFGIGMSLAISTSAFHELLREASSLCTVNILMMNDYTMSIKLAVQRLT